MDKTQHYVTEDVGNMPSLMKKLDVEDLKSDPSCCLPLQDRCEVCYRQGTDKPAHPEYKALIDRRKSFPESQSSGSSSLYLAETGLFWAGKKTLTCFQCGQNVNLPNGEDPLMNHADLFRNCKHVCRMMGYPNRRPRSGTEMTSCPTTPLLSSRRRVMSE